MKAVLSASRERRADSASAGMDEVLDVDVVTVGLGTVGDPAAFVVLSGLVSKSSCPESSVLGLEVDPRLLRFRGATSSR